LPERVNHLRENLRLCAAQESNHRHSWLLCANSERPCGCGASNNFDEISPAHATIPCEVKDDASIRSLSDQGGDVRFGSLADICSAKGHVRFTPESDIKCDSTVSFAGERKNAATEYIGGCTTCYVTRRKMPWNTQITRCDSVSVLLVEP
jgi:hypothetical protein